MMDSGSARAGGQLHRHFDASGNWTSCAERIARRRATLCSTDMIHRLDARWGGNMPKPGSKKAIAFEFSKINDN